VRGSNAVAKGRVRTWKPNVDDESEPGGSTKNARLLRTRNGRQSSKGISKQAISEASATDTKLQTVK
jgi:hypothetical protein